jgi:hypothetical protein
MLSAHPGHRGGDLTITPGIAQSSLDQRGIQQASDDLFGRNALPRSLLAFDKAQPNLQIIMG